MQYFNTVSCHHSVSRHSGDWLIIEDRSRKSGIQFRQSSLSFFGDLEVQSSLRKQRLVTQVLFSQVWLEIYIWKSSQVFYLFELEREGRVRGNGRYVMAAVWRHLTQAQWAIT